MAYKIKKDKIMIKLMRGNKSVELLDGLQKQEEMWVEYFLLWLPFVSTSIRPPSIS